jgi:hypothetical protein
MHGRARSADAGRDVTRLRVTRIHEHEVWSCTTAAPIAADTRGQRQGRARNGR